MSEPNEALLADEAPIHELEELKPLVAAGQERGTLSFAEVAQALEEVEVTKEQVAELHGYLTDKGIVVVGADGKLAQSEEGKLEAAAAARKEAQADGSSGGSAAREAGAGGKPAVWLII